MDPDKPLAKESRTIARLFFRMTLAKMICFVAGILAIGTVVAPMDVWIRLCEKAERHAAVGGTLVVIIVLLGLVEFTGTALLFGWFCAVFFGWPQNRLEWTAVISIPFALTLLFAALDSHRQHRKRYRLRRATLDRRVPVLFLQSYRYNSLRYIGGIIPQAKYVPAIYIDTTDILAYVYRDIGKLGPIISLGDPADPLESEAVIHLETDGRNWRSALPAIARDCSPIILVPEVSLGVLAECIWLIRTDLYQRALVIMSPQARRYQREPTVANRWKNVCEVYRANGLRLPDYDPAGMVYRPNRDFSISEAWSLDHECKRRPFRIAALAVRQSATEAGRPFSELALRAGLHYKGNRLAIGSRDFLGNVSGVHSFAVPADGEVFIPSGVPADFGRARRE